MTAATRKALETVRDLLHEAGWDAPRRAPEVTERAIAPMREAFGALLRADDLALISRTLSAGQPIEDAGRFADALRRLCAFAEVAEAQGFAPSDSA
jgi:hypothetical protein